MDPLGIKIFLLGKGVDQFVGEIIHIASPEREDGGHSVARGLAGAERILIGVDHHPVRGKRLVTGRGGQHGLGNDSEGCGGGRRVRRRRCEKECTTGRPREFPARH